MLRDYLLDLIQDPKTWTTLSLAYLASEWVIRLGMLAVVPFRRSPDAAKGWLLLVFFLPWPGMVLYWLIGRPKFPRWRRELLAQLLPRLGPLAQRLRHDPNLHRLELPDSLAQAGRLAQQLGMLPVLDGNTAELLPEYDPAIDRLAADIDAAQ